MTRQLTRNEVLSRPDALQAIRTEFDGVGSMGTWELESVDEEFRVKEAALQSGETIHIADLLAICSEKHVELAPELRALKGRVCYRGDSAKTAEGKLALYQTLAASPASIVAANSVISFGLFEGHKLSSADAVKAYLQSELKSLAATYIRLQESYGLNLGSPQVATLASKGQSLDCANRCTDTQRLGPIGNSFLKNSCVS